jgi:3-deoxy-7-phosphoheptulonate synthase
MIIHLSKEATIEQRQKVYDRITGSGLAYDIRHGSTGTDVIGVLGDVTKIEESLFAVRISRSYKLVSREYLDATRIVKSGDAEIGGKELVIMAGPCSLETEEQILAIAQYVSDLGIKIMRGGAYKPRTSPYSFQGMGLKGLELLARCREKYGLKIVTEATGLHHHIQDDGLRELKNVLENVIDFTDIIQVGARNMKSYGFLQELGMLTKQSKTPVLLKRGDSSTLKDFLLAAEYIVSNGNPNVILCLRGIRTFEEEKFQRYTPDIGAITVLKRESNLPVVFDPSHATGYRGSVYGASMAAVAAGADGLLIETHNDPANALCDGEQSITRAQLAQIKSDADKIRQIVFKG